MKIPKIRWTSIPTSQLLETFRMMYSFYIDKFRNVFPKNIDINLTAKCNLACTFCWGPDHLMDDGLTTRDWFFTLAFFRAFGTRSVVFTGGEPLLRKDLAQILSYAKSIGYRTTLSSNTLLLPRRYKDILQFVDDIGIPLDGENSKINKEMRAGNLSKWESFFDTLDILKLYPEIETTVRTVVSKKNIKGISGIGDLLYPYNNVIDRWKLYQFSPFSYGEINKDAYEITTEKFASIVNEVDSRYHARLNFDIQTQKSESAYGRYVFIDPRGKIYGVNSELNYTNAGSIMDNDLLQLIHGISKVFTKDKNNIHATKYSINHKTKVTL